MRSLPIDDRPAPAAMPLHPRSVGEVLDAAFQLYRSRFVALLLVTAVGVAPISLVTSWLVLFEAGAWSGDGDAVGLMLGLLGMLSLIPMALVYGALTWAVARVAEGQSVSIGAAYMRGARTFPALFVAGLLVFLLVSMGLVGVVVAGTLFSLPIVALAGMTGETGGFLLTLLGFLLLGIVGGVAFAVFCGMFFGVMPLVVLDRLGPFASVRRSFELSRGGRLKIVAVLLVAWLIVLLPSIGISIMFIGPAAMLDPTANANMPATVLALQSVANFASSILTTPFLVACLVLLYYDRRVATEAFDLERAVDQLERGIR
ncbi:MAG TPA: hypothetical protein VK837_05225 [Longimicrobiales bacterium]|nr:hypothetical protein [Longimicrobiales bacterium]